MDQTSPLAAPNSQTGSLQEPVGSGTVKAEPDASAASVSWLTAPIQKAPAPFAVQSAQPPPPQQPFQTFNHSVNVNVAAPTIVFVQKKTGPNIVVRALWFIFFGSWLGVLTLAAAHIATLTIIGIPLGFWLYNRVPSVATLRPRTQETKVRTADGVTYIETMNQAQLPLWQRLLYFIFVGWWLSTIWYALALVIAVGVITLPISVMMLDRIGGIATLHKH